MDTTRTNLWTEVSPGYLWEHAWRTSYFVAGWRLRVVAAIGVGAFVIGVLRTWADRADVRTAILSMVATWLAMGVFIGFEVVMRRVRARGDILGGRLHSAAVERNRLESQIRDLTVSGRRRDELGQALAMLNDLSESGAAMLSIPVTDRTSFDIWMGLQNHFIERLSSELKPRLLPHEWQRIQLVEFDTRVSYVGAFNDEHHGRWHQTRARVGELRLLQEKYAQILHPETSIVRRGD